MHKKITKNYIINKASEIVESNIKKGSNRSKDVIFLHSIIGLLAEAYYQYFINKNVVKKENPYYDFYDTKNNIKIEIKTISYTTIKNSNYIKIGNYNSIQQIDPKFDIIEFIAVLKPSIEVKEVFLNDENEYLKNCFKYIGYITKNNILKYRFKSKYNNFFYISKNNFRKILVR